jgi:alanine racemase
MYPVRTIGTIVEGKFLQQGEDHLVKYLLHDSRRVSQGTASLFFALKTDHGNGHRFIKDAWKRGVRNFIVSEPVAVEELEDSNIILVSDSLQALQKLAAHHRSRFSIPVIGITGSNGKTIVKEWLHQLLQQDHNIVRSPKSYNSQVGVALSVWQMNGEHNLAIFEAGISKPGEMKRLEEIIRPTIGILTNIGAAHGENFGNNEHKAEEKIGLFHDAQAVIFPYDDAAAAKAVIAWNEAEYQVSGKHKFEALSWGSGKNAGLRIIQVEKSERAASIRTIFRQKEFTYNLPFTDEASLSNALTCVCVLLHLGYDAETINGRLAALHTVDMRLQLNHGINSCLIINDSYSTDLTSLKIALEFLQQQSPGLRRTAVLSDFMESGRADEELYRDVAALLELYGISRVYGIGGRITEHLSRHTGSFLFTPFPSTAAFIAAFKSSQFYNEAILVKGARVFEFEQIAQLFERKVHQTVLEINLNALAHNLKEYQKVLHPGTRLMAMVKAFSYGSGGAEIASVLQYHNVQYLGVAYADEGVDLVRSGITLPIMVMNTDESTFQSVVEYNLQPVIYSFDLLHRFEHYLREQALQDYPVHIEVETGMNRLGFGFAETEALAQHLSRTDAFRVQSVFSHLSSSEDASQDDFTRQQGELFSKAVAVLQKHLPYAFIRHIANTAGILRHPHLQMDMVRLGIGLYGIETVESSLDLQAVATLRSTIAQVKHLKKGESVSYNRRWIAQRDSVIATVRIGYADGYSRRFGNGTGKMWVQGKMAPVVGSVCMDMTMIDITDLPEAREGDEVIVFGQELPVQELAAWIGTIPYEIMTSISQRVKRVYFHE